MHLGCREGVGRSGEGEWGARPLASGWRGENQKCVSEVKFSWKQSQRQGSCTCDLLKKCSWRSQKGVDGTRQ